MSAAPTMCDNPCETCAKQGLPLLLARYALMPSEIGAPRLAGELNAPELSQVPLGKTAHYGLRLLRSGYVYVFDEARGHWDEYFVTTDGYLTKLPVRTVVRMRQQPATEFRCARDGAAPLAGVITIRNAKHADKVWIAFSDVEWTDAVFQAHQQADERRRHMKCVTVGAGKVGAQADTAPLAQLEQLLPEFKMDAHRAAEQFGRFSPHAYNARSGRAARLLQAVEQVRPGGGAAIVALHDPVGLAMEIASLAELRKTTFMHHESVSKPRFAASAIAGLESTVRTQAKLELMAATEALAQRIEEGPAAYNANAALFGIQGDPQEAERWRTPTPQSLARAADQAWQNYTVDRTGKPRLDYAGSQAWLKRHHEEFLKFDTEQIAPLAQAHAAWMQHRCMVSQLSCNHDSADRDSGVAYTATVVELLRHTTDKQPSYELYLKWMKAGEFTEANLVMRALGFNQKELIDKIRQADAAAVSLRVFPSDAVAGAIAAFMEKMPASANAQLTALLAGLSGPTLKYWSEFAEAKASGKAAAALAAVSGKQIVRLPIAGNRGQFIQAYMRELYRLDPTLKTTPNQLQAAIAKQVKLLEIEGVKMNSKSTLGWYVLLDRQAVSAAAQTARGGQALADELAKAIRTPQDIQKLDDGARSALVRKLAFGGATVLSGVLMLVNYTKLLEDVENAMAHAQTEATAKLWAGRVAIGGFVAEQIGNRLEKQGEAKLRNMMGRVGAKIPRALQIGGRLAGFGVGVFVGGWDVWKGKEASQREDYGLAAAYRISGGTGIVVSATMFGVGMGWVVLGPVGWLALMVGIVIWLGATWYIESNKDNALHEWLVRCHFGAAPESEKYPDVKTHVEEYKRALAS